MVNLYFLHVPGCEACEMASPGVKHFAKLNPAIHVFKVDLSQVKWPEQLRWQPRATPTYVLHNPEQHRVVIREGAFEKPNELIDWVDQKILPPHEDIVDAEVIE